MTLEELAKAEIAAMARALATVYLPDEIGAEKWRAFYGQAQRAHAAAAKVREEAGYVLVPRRPTEEMLASCGNGECAKWAPGAWENMIATLQSTEAA